MAASNGQRTAGIGELALQFLPSSRSVGDARRAVGEFCRSGEHPALADDAELLTSELVTNACRYATGLVTVFVLSNAANIVVTVTDDHVGGEPLAPTQPAPYQDAGRGLFLVDSISAAWGTTTHDGGKSVWFRLPR